MSSRPPRDGVDAAPIAWLKGQKCMTGPLPRIKVGWEATLVWMPVRASWYGARNIGKMGRRSDKLAALLLVGKARVEK